MGYLHCVHIHLGSHFQTYAVHDGPYRERAQEIYAELRKNVIDNTFKVGLKLHVLALSSSRHFQEYERTGFVWEQYDATTGEGRRRYVLLLVDITAVTHCFMCSHPFTGWTSLVTLSGYF